MRGGGQELSRCPGQLTIGIYFYKKKPLTHTFNVNLWQDLLCFYPLKCFFPLHCAYFSLTLPAWRIIYPWDWHLPMTRNTDDSWHTGGRRYWLVTEGHLLWHIGCDNWNYDKVTSHLRGVNMLSWANHFHWIQIKSFLVPFCCFSKEIEYQI